MSERTTPEQKPTLDTLAAAIEAARHFETLARETRIEAEEKLAQILGSDEIPTTFHGDNFDVTTQARAVREVDPLALGEVFENLDLATVSRLFPLRHALDVTEYIKLRNTNSEQFAVASRAVNVSHVSPSITIQRRGA